MSRALLHSGGARGTFVLGGGEGGCEALEVESSVEEDAAIACSRRTEESASEGLRLAEEWTAESAVWRREIFVIQDVLGEGGKREAVFARDGSIQLSGTALIAA